MMPLVPLFVTPKAQLTAGLSIVMLQPILIQIINDLKRNDQRKTLIYNI